MTELFITLSAIFSIVAYVPYTMAILKSRGKDNALRPNRASWFVWALIDYIMVFSLLGAKSYGAVPMFVAFSLGSTIIFLLSLKYGEGGFTPFDLICVALGLSGIVGWLTLGTPLASIVASLIAAYAGAFPTIKKALKDPFGEDLMTWVLFMIGGLFGCLAIEAWTFEKALTPIAILAIQTILVLSIVVSRQLMKLRERIGPRGGW